MLLDLNSLTAILLEYVGTTISSKRRALKQITASLLQASNLVSRGFCLFDIKTAAKTKISRNKIDSLVNLLMKCDTYDMQV